MLMLNAEPDKRARESVTVCYITCNAAEPHDQCLGGGGTARSFWQGTHNLIIFLLGVETWGDLLLFTLKRVVSKRNAPSIE